MDFDKTKDDIDKWFDGKTQEEIQNIVDIMDKVFKKSIEDSEDVLLFAEWLQYNGKYQLPEQQVKSFLKIVYEKFLDFFRSKKKEARIEYDEYVVFQC
jgi:NifU-like protein involved in Fe-S cluster formation